MGTRRARAGHRTGNGSCSSRSTFVETDPDPVASRSHRELHVVTLDGSEPVELLGGPTDDFEPVWAPDGSEIALVRIVDPGPGGPDATPQIWTLRPDGSGALQVTTFEPGAWRPAWSPDGSMLAFDDAGSDIYLIGADGEGLRRLKLPPGWGGEGESPHGAAWSPDGARIAFGAGGEQGHDVFVVDPDGSNLERLTGPGGQDDDPSWVAPSEATSSPTAAESPTPTTTECFESKSTGDFDGEAEPTRRRSTRSCRSSAAVRRRSRPTGGSRSVSSSARARSPCRSRTARTCSTAPCCRARTSTGMGAPSSP